MKTKWMTVFLICSTLVSLGQAAEKNVDVTVNGMVCPFCAQGITKKFKALPEVAAVKVLLANQMVYLTFKDGSDMTDEAITKILHQAGYSVEKVERKTP